jgi:secreted trypsin-like serine protease
MTKINFTAAALACFIVLQSLVVRHDVKDAELLKLAKNYPQICHFKNGEGTLIKSNWILTAAHLGELYVNSKDSLELTVECNGKKYFIEKVFVHPGYSSDTNGVKNDIALIKLTTEVSNVVPAAAYTKKDEKNKIITLIGRGYPGNGLVGEQKEKWDRKTRYATNRIDTIAGEYLRFTFDKPGSKNSTKYEGVSGPGDSGGPAFIDTGGKRFIIGVSSHQFAMIEVDDNGKEQGGPGYYGAIENYTRVSDYKDWINSVIAKN